MVGVVMDAQLEQFFPPEAATKPIDPGPSAQHRLHGTIPIMPVCELRVTSQPRRDRIEGARLVIRLWYLRQDSGTWWPSKREGGVFVLAKNARAFLAAVTAAVEAIEQDGGGEP
jgi:hypothetical protein